ncbi:MAG: sulfotransferase domain-containing protein [Candidatus Woesearchaeota archaeon]
MLNAFKIKIRFLLRFLTLNKKYKYQYDHLVILSTGRSGSTLLTDSLRDSFLQKYLFLPISFKKTFNLQNTDNHFLKDQLRKMVYGYVKKIEEINLFTPPIIKSHDYCNFKKNKNIKIVFIFRNPLNILSSILFKIDNNEDVFLREHLSNLDGKFSIEEILNQDVLNYVGVSNSFIESSKKDEILFFDFEDLNSHFFHLSKELNLDIQIPTLSDRKLHPKIKNLHPDLKQNLLETYNSLRMEIKY